MTSQHSRRDLFRAGAAIGGGALVAAVTTEAWAAQPRAAFTAMIAASKVASRTDRRPVAGGVYDATADKTFICWAGKNSDTYVQSYDHPTKVWSKPAKVLSPGGDSHNYPTMVQAADGRLLVFVGVHNSQLVVARSAQPHAVTGTWSVTNVKEGADASYPMPFRLANGDIFVFFRRTDSTDTRPMVYVKSTDHGVTWKGTKTLTGASYAFGSTGRSDHLNEVYIGQLRPDVQRVHIVWTIAGGGPSKHEHDAYHKDIYYATFDPATLSFRTVGGADLGTQLTDAELDKCRVVQTALAKPGGVKSPDYIQLVGWLDDGRPVLVFMTADTKGALHTSAALWTGTAWQVKEVATGLRVRDMEPAGPDTWRVYATRDDKANIETYLLAGGQTWTAESVIGTAKAVQRIEVIGGYRDPARILATGAPSGRPVSTADGDIYVAGA